MKLEFRDKIYRLTKKIPKSKVATYGQLAILAGRKNAARAVGYFMKSNPNAPITPCHRVVAADESLTGYSGRGGMIQKKKMLIGEGVSFKNNRVDLSKSLWRP